AHRGAPSTVVRAAAGVRRGPARRARALDPRRRARPSASEGGEVVAARRRGLHRAGPQDVGGEVRQEGAARALPRPRAASGGVGGYGRTDTNMKYVYALLAAISLARAGPVPAPTAPVEQRRLYVAAPGIRNYVEWGGKGVLVYDIDHGHAFVKRIPSPFDDPGGKVENIKAVCASAATRRLYVTSLTRLACIDLHTERRLWVKALEAGCDR